MTAFVSGFAGLAVRSRGMFGSRSSTINETIRSTETVERRLRPAMIRGFPNNFNNDTANNNSDGQNRVFDQLVDFPCVFTFKVIGMAQGDFMGDIVDTVASALDTDKKYVKTSFRDRGKYRSITLKAPVNTAEQIYNVYAAIDRDPRVKFKF